MAEVNVATPEAPTSDVPAVPAEKKASPAQDLRDIQMLLLGGVFPGNVAPAVVKAYQLLESMAVKVESNVENK